MLMFNRYKTVSAAVRLLSALIVLSVVGLLASCGGSSTTPTPPPPIVTATSTCNFGLRGLSQECSFSYTDAKGAQTRKFVLHIPNSFVSSQGMVLYLHGAGGTDTEGDNTGWTQKSDSVGFIAIYPQALPVGPNGGNSWADYFSPGLNNPPDDVTFISQIITYFEGTPLLVNPSHVYVTGFSAGAYMAHRVAVELSSQVAAIASVSGALMESSAGASNLVQSAKGPVSILMLNGDADLNVGYCGENDSAGISSSVDETFNYWTSAKANACAFITPAPSANPSTLCDLNHLPTTIVTRKGASCLKTTEVIAYQLHAGTHQFYGLSSNGVPLPLNVSPGTSTAPFNINFAGGVGTTTVDVCWNFFQSHSKK